jgi:hypothetical protein
MVHRVRAIARQLAILFGQLGRINDRGKYVANARCG